MLTMCACLALTKVSVFFCAAGLCEQRDGGHGARKRSRRGGHAGRAGRRAAGRQGRRHIAAWTTASASAAGCRARSRPRRWRPRSGLSASAATAMMAPRRLKRCSRASVSATRSCRCWSTTARTGALPCVGEPAVLQPSLFRPICRLQLSHIGLLHLQRSSSCMQPLNWLSSWCTSLMWDFWQVHERLHVHCLLQKQCSTVSLACLFWLAGGVSRARMCIPRSFHVATADPAEVVDRAGATAAKVAPPECGVDRRARSLTRSLARSAAPSPLVQLLARHRQSRWAASPSACTCAPHHLFVSSLLCASVGCPPLHALVLLLFFLCHPVLAASVGACAMCWRKAGHTLPLPEASVSTGQGGEPFLRRPFGPAGRT